MSTKRCPACRSEVPAQAKDCPYCPFSFKSDEDHARPKKRFGPSSWSPAVWAAIVLGLMVLAGRAIEFVIANADPDAKNSTMQKFVDQQRIVVHDKDGNEKVISEGGGVRDEKARLVAGASGPRGISVDQRLDGAPDAAAADDGAGAANLWRLRGVVYDLVTLKPIPACTIYFTNPDTRARFETSTDDAGSYRTLVPSLDLKGYEVTFAKEGYARSYLNPGTENVPQMTAEDRSTLAKELAAASDPPYTVEAVDASPFVTDFYLAPAAP